MPKGIPEYHYKEPYRLYEGTIYYDRGDNSPILLHPFTATYNAKIGGWSISCKEIGQDYIHVVRITHRRIKDLLKGLTIRYRTADIVSKRLRVVEMFWIKDEKKKKL